jgi:hypothetical protein
MRRVSLPESDRTEFDVARQMSFMGKQMMVDWGLRPHVAFRCQVA